MNLKRNDPPPGQTPEQEVAEQARRRAAALAAGDEATLRSLMHPGLQWTTFRGDVLGYEEYIAGNTGGKPRWRAQRLAGIKVVVAGDTAVLTAAATDEVSVDGQDQAFHLRLTQTWVRTPAGWRCLAGHASLPVLLPARPVWPVAPVRSALLVSPAIIVGQIRGRGLDLGFQS